MKKKSLIETDGPFYIVQEKPFEVAAKLFEELRYVPDISTKDFKATLEDRWKDILASYGLRQVSDLERYIVVKLSTEESRIIASWSNNIRKGLRKKLDELPLIKKKAEIILMEYEQKRKDHEEQSNLFEIFSRLIDDLPVNQAKNLIKNYDKEYKHIEDELRAWTSVEEQIKNQILNNEKTKKENKDRQEKPSDPLSESGEDHY